jgi:hypothetical protein
LHLFGRHGIITLILPPGNLSTLFYMSSENRSRNWRRFQAGRHMLMGLLLIALGYAVVHYHSFGQMELSNTSSYTLAAILAIYGLFRIWRGTVELRKKEDADDFIT